MPIKVTYPGVYIEEIPSGVKTIGGVDTSITAFDAAEWKYVSVRRQALFIGESISRDTRWAVFEPNREPLWTKIRQQVVDFLHNLYVQKAFAGAKTTDAYFVKCGTDTITQNDRDEGIVNILVGFAPAKPAEFVTLRVQQKTAEAQDGAAAKQKRRRVSRPVASRSARTLKPKRR